MKGDEYLRIKKKKGVTIYLLYDEREELEIEEKICRMNPKNNRIINEHAIKRELGRDALGQFDLGDCQSYVLSGWLKKLKEVEDLLR